MPGPAEVKHLAARFDRHRPARRLPADRAKAVAVAHGQRRITSLFRGEHSEGAIIDRERVTEGDAVQREPVFGRLLEAPAVNECAVVFVLDDDPPLNGRFGQRLAGPSQHRDDFVRRPRAHTFFEVRQDRCRELPPEARRHGQLKRLLGVGLDQCRQRLPTRLRQRFACALHGLSCFAGRGGKVLFDPMIERRDGSVV